MIWTQVGERLGKIRQDRKLSKAQFGKLIGVSGQYVGMVERGDYGLSVEAIERICRITGLSADFILFGAIPPQEFETITELYGLSHEQIQIALDIIIRVSQFINTENGNEALIQEVIRQQCVSKNIRLLTETKMD